MRYLLLIVSAVVICAGCWTEQEVVTDVTTDTDADSDSDSDTDTDTGSDSDSASDTDTGSDTYECNAPESITNWGGPCHTTADCPPDTECIIIDFLDATQGVCAAECCNFSMPDPTYCTDVAAGQEGCIFGKTNDEGISFYPPFHCIIVCNTQTDCPTDTACVDAGGASICYGYAS